MSNDWVVTLTFDVDPTDEQFDELADFLDENDAAVSRIPGRGIAATTYAFGDLPLLEATEQGARWLSIAVDAEPTGIEVLTMEAYAERAEAPSMPELMSAAEIADELGISRQRVHQLRSTAGFPDPLADLRGGAVWDAAAIRKFNEEWTRKPGRPRNVDGVVVNPDGGVVLGFEVKTTSVPAAAQGRTWTVKHPKSGQTVSRSAVTGKFVKEGGVRKSRAKGAITEKTSGPSDSAT